jgi:hypothetical protein
MSHNYQHKKRNSSDSSESSASSSEAEKYDGGRLYDQCRACIVCPPSDYKERYDSSGSDNSGPDFSALCEDKPRIYVEKKDYLRKYNKEKSEDSPSSDESSDNDYFDNKAKKCSGCNNGCGNCNNCRACGCRECSDYSRASVIKSLGSDSSDRGCANFDHLVYDERRKNVPLFNHCKQKDNSSVDSSTKDASSQASSSNKKDDHDRKWAFAKKDNRKNKRKNLRKQVTKEESSSSSSSQKTQEASSAGTSASRGKKFVVSFGPKEGHQWAEYNNGDESIHINGKNGPVLHLYRGSTYFFCVEQSNVNDDSSEDAKHFFFLTNSPIGGAGANLIQGGFAPVSKGCVCFKVDKCTPRYFYYQSSKHTFEGGLVIVHDK